MEFTLLAAVAVGAMSTYAVLWWESGRTNAADCTRAIWDALITAAVIGMIVGRLVSMVRAGVNPLANPTDILIVRGGVDTIAASASALGTFAWMTRTDLRAMMDAAAPAAIAGLAGWHGGCLVRDACLGTRTDLPWAMSQANSGIGRHPVEIYAALLLLAGVIGLAWLKSRRPTPGRIGIAALALAGAVRAATEPMRVGIGSDLRWWYLGCALAAVSALIVPALMPASDGDRP